MTALHASRHTAPRQHGRQVRQRVLTLTFMGLLSPLFVLGTLVTFALGRLNRVGQDGEWDTAGRDESLWS